MIPELLLYGAIYAFIGLLAGLIAGIFGVGGGIIVVPGLVFIFQINQLIPEQFIMHVAAGTSLTVMIFTSQASLRAHYKLGEVLWPIFNKLCFGLIAGSVSGAALAECVSTYWLKIIFALFLIVVALKLLIDLHVEHDEQLIKAWLNRLVSYLTGLTSGLLGVGGGVLIIPYLTYCGVAVRKIPAISNLCSFVVAVTGTIVFMITGQDEMVGVPYSTGYIYWPAVLCVAIPSSIIVPLGAKLNYLLPVKQLKGFFIVILLLTAIKMLF